MAVEDPSYFQRVPLRRHIRDEEFRFHLYLFQHFPSNPYDNQLVVMSPNRPNGYGAMVIQDWEVRDGLTMESKVVARAQGLHVGAGKYEGNWVNSLCIVFIDDRFKESSLNVLGTYGDLTSRVELAIVGGTGEFAFAQGVASCKTIRDPPGVMGTVRELHIRARCMAFPEQPVPVTRIGPWGGNGRTEFDIPAESVLQRLEGITVRSGIVINSIAFSYTDLAGTKQTLGPWGGDGELTDKIIFAPLEIVKEVSGTTGTFDGDTVVTSLTFISNVRTYGPFGKTNGGTAFSVPLMDTNVVGFFVRAGRLVNALGVYVRLSIQS